MPTNSPRPVAVRSIPVLRASLAGVERAGGAYLIKVVLDARGRVLAALRQRAGADPAGVR